MLWRSFLGHGIVGTLDPLGFERKRAGWRTLEVLDRHAPWGSGSTVRPTVYGRPSQAEDNRPPHYR